MAITWTNSNPSIESDMSMHVISATLGVKTRECALYWTTTFHPHYRVRASQFERNCRIRYPCGLCSCVLDWGTSNYNVKSVPQIPDPR
jgi:hypothetical protein